MSSVPLKFYYLTSGLVIGIAGVIGQNGGALLFFLGQGSLIQAAIAGPNNGTRWSIVLLFVWVAAAKLLMMFSNIVSEHGRLYVSQKELSHQLNTRFPARVYKDYAGRGNDILHAFTEYVPQCVENAYQRFINNFSFALIMSLILVVGLWQQFYLGLVLALMILSFSFVHQRAFGNTLERKVQRVQKHYRGLVQWIGEYFSGYKELSKNWGNMVTSGRWLHDKLQDYCRSKRALNRAILGKDLVVQPLVEMPFLLATLVILGAVYYRYVNFAIAFMWIGLLQNALAAAQSLGKNVELDKKQKQARYHIEEVIDSIERTNVFHNAIKQNLTNDARMVRLRDGSQTRIDICPGFYHIVGGNGSGKSTLLDTLTGYDRQNLYADQPVVANLKGKLGDHEIRIIDNQPVLFSDLAGLRQQLSGPLARASMDLFNNLYTLLPSNLANHWRELYDELDYKMNNLTGYQCSSGQKIIVSFFRALITWDNDVKLLIVDECDAVLDGKNRRMFLDSLQCLAQFVAVYYVSHSSKEASGPDCHSELATMSHTVS